MQLMAIPSWRCRLVLDAYRQFPDGVARNKQVEDAYVHLVEQSGHSLAQNFGATIRDEKHRNSSHSPVYVGGGWNARRLDLFYRLEKARWGIRPDILEQFSKLRINEQTVFGGLPPAQVKAKEQSVFTQVGTGLEPDEQYVYVMEIVSEFLKLTPGQHIVKIGKSEQPVSRQGELQTGNPFPIERRIEMKVPYASALENRLHNSMAGRRMSGEWFYLTTPEIEQLGSLVMTHAMNYGAARWLTSASSTTTTSG